MSNRTRKKPLPKSKKGNPKPMKKAKKKKNSQHG